MRLESYHEVKDFCRQNHLLEPSDRVLVAFSGGADSVYLARALLELSQEWDFVVELIHVNHQIRGEEAERDEMFCKSFAEENGIRIHICRGDVPKMVQEQKYSLEEAARIYRYRCIEETAEQYGFQKVAIAHHQDDQAETVLFQMLRGSGVRGWGECAQGMADISVHCSFYVTIKLSVNWDRSPSPGARTAQIRRQIAAVIRSV